MEDGKPTRAATLAGVRVLDLTRVLAGPFCTMILADLGAEVVKIERPGTGDDTRAFGPFLPSGLSGYFASINRGKKSITLDLKTPQDKQTFLELVRHADVVVENFRAGTMKSFGLEADRLKEVNPRLVYVSASGFGKDGVHGRRPAYDIIIQAMSGLISVTGIDPSQPVGVGVSISDMLTGLYMAIGILAALRLRDRDEKGVELDMAMLDCTVAAVWNAIVRYEATGQVPGPIGTRHPSLTPFQSFETADGAIVVAVAREAFWVKFCGAIDRPDLIEDTRFQSNEDRTARHGLLEQLLKEVFHARTSQQWLSRFEEAGVPCAPIRNMAEVVSDAHLESRGMLHVMTDGRGTSFRTAGSPLCFDGVPRNLSSRVPELGEHNEEIISKWLQKG